jgi:hypothetical protein
MVLSLLQREVYTGCAMRLADSSKYSAFNLFPYTFLYILFSLLLYFHRTRCHVNDTRDIPLPPAVLECLGYFASETPEALYKEFGMPHPGECRFLSNLKHQQLSN